MPSLMSTILLITHLENQQMDPKPFSPSGIHNICYCKRNTSIHLLQPIFLVIYKKIKCWADVKGQENMNDSIPACLS